MATWILQSNPKLYEIESSLRTRPIIYWRVPQLFEQVKAGDRVLIWRGRAWAPGARCA